MSTKRATEVQQKKILPLGAKVKVLHSSGKIPAFEGTIMFYWADSTCGVLSSEYNCYVSDESSLADIDYPYFVDGPEVPKNCHLYSFDELTLLEVV